MTPYELYTELQSRGVIFQVRSERLHIEAPKGVLTPEIRSALIEYKPNLLLLVTEKQSQSEMDLCTLPFCGRLLTTTTSQLSIRQECPSGHFSRFVYQVEIEPADDLIVDHCDERACQKRWPTVKAWVNQLGAWVCCRCFPPRNPQLVSEWIEIVPAEAKKRIN